MAIEVYRGFMCSYNISLLIYTDSPITVNGFQSRGRGPFGDLPEQQGDIEKLEILLLKTFKTKVLSSRCLSNL